MKTLESLIKKSVKAALPLAFIAMPVLAQNQVTGNVKSFESNALARVTLTNTSNNSQHTAITNPLSGDFSLNVPSGT